MGLPITVHVGPYVEFLVPEGHSVNHDLLEVALESCGFNHNLEFAETIVSDGVKHGRDCFAPYYSRNSPDNHKPPRSMHFSDNSGEKQVSALDLTRINVAEEIAWFERTYAAELKALAEGYGVPMHIRWGVMLSM